MDAISSGASSSVRRIEGGRVAKVFHAAVSEEMIEREFAVATHAAECGVPVARPIERIDMPAGRAIIYPEITGPTMLMHMRKHPLGSGSSLRQMGLLHQRIHACTAPALRPLKQVLSTDIAYGPASPELQEAAQRLLDSLPDGEALLHGDFHLGNVLVAPEGPTAIDWSKAARGDITADILRTEMLLRFGQGPEDPLTNMARDWAARRYLLISGGLTPGGLKQVAPWRAVVALAWLRARAPVRQQAFSAYLRRSLSAAGLPLSK